MEEIRFSVGQASTPGLSFAEDLDVFRRAGAQGIGVDVERKVRDPHDDLARFRDSGLTATFCFPDINSVFLGSRQHGPNHLGERIDALCDSIRFLSDYSPLACVCGPGRYQELGGEEGYSLAVAGLRRAARVAAGEGFPIMLEPHHPSLASGWTTLVTLAGAVKMVEDIGEPNVGILFDIWHLWDSPNVRDLLVANIDLILGVQVDDWREPTRSWCDRVLPGDGIADVAGLLRLLRVSGYDGWLDLEIFSDDGSQGNAFEDSLWAKDPEWMIRTAFERTTAAWNS